MEQWNVDLPGECEYAKHPLLAGVLLRNDFYWLLNTRRLHSPLRWRLRFRMHRSPKCSR